MNIKRRNDVRNFKELGGAENESIFIENRMSKISFSKYEIENCKSSAMVEQCF